MVEFIIAILFLSALLYLAKILYASFGQTKKSTNNSCCNTKICLPKP